MNKHQWRVGDAGLTVFGPKRDDGQAPEIIATCRKREHAAVILQAVKFYNKRAELIDAFKAVLRDHSATINGLCQVCGHYGDDCTAHKALAILREMGEA